MDDLQGLSPDVWHVADVCWFECGSSATVETAGNYDVSFRVKRLPNMTFGAEIILILNGTVARHAKLKRELTEPGTSDGTGWQLLHVLDPRPRRSAPRGRSPPPTHTHTPARAQVGTTTVPQGGSQITANMRSAEQSWWKRGLLIDCMVIMAAGRRDRFFDYAPVEADHLAPTANGHPPHHCCSVQ